MNTSSIQEISVEEKLLEITSFLESSSQNKESTYSEFSLDSLSVLYGMAFELYKNGKFNDSKSFFRFLTLIDSFERKYWMGLAASYQMLKQYEAAIECYSAAALQDFNDPYVHCHAADCFFHLGCFDKAREALESAIIIAQSEKHHHLIQKLLLLRTIWSTLPHGGRHA